MTYCLGMLLDAGLVLMADTRTNAGVDNFSTFRKLHVLLDEPGREVYAASAGNLSLTQSAIGFLNEGRHRKGSPKSSRSLDKAENMFRVAQLVGETVEKVGATIGAALAREHIDNSIEMLVGGRIGDGPIKLFLIYTIGNFIECTSDVPFLQIGETKYGRPILDRALSYDTSLAEAAKIGILSFDSTMESNLGVAQPIDLIVMPSDPAKPSFKHRIEEEDAYFLETKRRWARILSDGVTSLPDPPWLTPGSQDQ